MKVSNALSKAEELLAHQNEPRLRSRLLMQHVLDADVAQLISHERDEMEARQQTVFFQLVERAVNEPVYRIIGRREFHGLFFELSDDTLEPRDDTEALIDLVLDKVRTDLSGTLRFADLGTGTGAIGLSLLHEIPKAEAILTDISDGALDVARRNADWFDCASRCELRRGAWCEPLDGTFDFIVSNPPYISTDVIETLDPSVKNYDPHLALDGGKDGLDAYRTIMADAAQYLRPNGFLALEIGFDQAESLEQLGVELGWKLIETRKDFGGNNRAQLYKPV